MFFKNRKSDNKELLKICALLIHAAKIDENYSDEEKKIIKKALIEISKNDENIDEILEKAERLESDSNQILEFTREVKNMSHENKIKIVETLWKIIYSNNEADIYETGLMRRLAGLLYIDSKTMGTIKEKIIKEIS
tara:strand:+ start:301 stop:708 length:408 start_codon:yes stop_codon:yes gene_type:complete